MLLGGTSRPGNWRGERKQAGVAGCGWLMTKHSAQPAGRQDRTGFGYGTATKPRVWGQRQFRDTGRKAGLLRRAYRGDMRRGEDAVSFGDGWRYCGR